MRSPKIISFVLASTFIQSIRAARFLRNVDSGQSNSLPGNWTSIGCYTDNVGGRTLSAVSYVDPDQMTIESCVDFCDTRSYVYAGLEWSQECYCGNYIANGGSIANAADCNMPCKGDPSEVCGAGNRLSVFDSGRLPPPMPTTVPSVGEWLSLGCYSDSPAARTLTQVVNIESNCSIETCTSACYDAGFILAGAEYSTQCFCGLDIENGGASTPDSDCNMVCGGNDLEYCGGPARLNLYNYTGTPPSPPSSGGGNGGTSNPAYPVIFSLPEPWTYSGCWVDNRNGRVFMSEIPDNSSTTVEGCIALCDSQNFTLAGTEWSVQCFCGNELIGGAVQVPDSDCNMGCGGNTTEACGGPSRVSVYTSTGNVTALPIPIVKNASLPGQWQYQGCLAEPGAVRVLPYQNIYEYNNTVDGCLNQCAFYGFPAGGMEYSDECWCGDIWDVTNNGGFFADEATCNMPCSGDPTHLCGGQQRLSLYYWDPSNPLNVWHTPDNTGYYEFLVGGVVVPLIATVGVNNKVTFLEKGGTGFPNSTGAYELDLSLVSNFSAAWREMHVKTDVFCSGSIILPDKAARQLNVGGWSLTSTFGVRLYTPDGTPGLASHNDWEENPNELYLQKGRWYPTALVMANGSVLVMGGETGSNGPPEPSLEILPTPEGGDTTVYLEWLQRTDPNNLYPFLFVLPSGNIFVAYYNEARILDPGTFDTLTTLPNLPAAVNNFLGGRTYPLEAAAVLLPQYAPYTDPVTVLICGGSTPGAGIALDNCASLMPEVLNAAWALERMPSKRVMPCMVALPDGTFMIMNGAYQGYAGFGLASDPNLVALLYDPTLPVGQRMSILNSTIVARLYHSEATLLPDGRVLVSGSDPETYYPNGTEVYPEEFRIEVYVPPYLSQGLTQPELTVENTDWSYGGLYSVDVTLYQGTVSTLRISLVAATSSTHGNTMGGRTLFPAFSCSTTTTNSNLSNSDDGAGDTASCTITAPPNANVSPPGWHQLFVLDGPTPSHSRWVRIGGDPARLGEWPDYPDFTLPGV